MSKQIVEVGSYVRILSGKHTGVVAEVTDIAKGWVTVGWVPPHNPETGEFEAPEWMTANLRAAALEACDMDGSDLSEADDEDEADDVDAPEGDEASEEEGEEEGEEGGSNLARQVAKYRPRYERATNASGSKTLVCGDDLSYKLLALSPVAVCRLADFVCAEPTGHHELRYASLNPGQQRMNSGNKVRAAIKRAYQQVQDAEGEEAQTAASAEFDSFYASVVAKINQLQATVG